MLFSEFQLHAHLMGFVGFDAIDIYCPEDISFDLF